MAKESASSQIALEEAKNAVIPILVRSFNSTSKLNTSVEMAKPGFVLFLLFYLHSKMTPYCIQAHQCLKRKFNAVCYSVQRCRVRSLIGWPGWPWNYRASSIIWTLIQNYLTRFFGRWLSPSSSASLGNYQRQLPLHRPSRPPSQVLCPAIIETIASIDVLPSINQELCEYCTHCPSLPNIGSTCFFNSTLQVLLTVKDQLLVHFEQARTGCTHEIFYQNKAHSIQVTVEFADRPMISAFLEFLKAVKDEENISIKLRQLHSKIGERYNRFRSFNQQDSEEVLRCLLDGIRMEEIEAVREEITSKLKGHGAKESENEAVLKECLRATFKLKTLVDKIFGGSCVNTVICRECLHPLQLIEPFLDLSVPMPDKNEPVSQSTESSKDAAVCPMLLRALLEKRKMFKSLKEDAGSPASPDSLEHCLKLYTALDILDEDNKFICDRCTEEKKKQEGNDEEYAECLVSKQLLVHELPPILILHMKRFHLGRQVTKNNNHINFPDTLDVASFCSDEVKEGTEYELFGVVQHSGSLQGGHYVAYVKYKDCPVASNKDRVWKADGGESGYPIDAKATESYGCQMVEETSGTESGFSNAAQDAVQSGCQGNHYLKIASTTDDSKKDIWCYTSDSNVSFTDEKDVHDSQAYLLFYVQCN